MYQTSTQTRCTANITVGRGRIRQYSDTVYLKDGQSFEIELFNPKNSAVLAKISINGVSISSSGIVLKPGQRVFLERFIDEPRKFKFETYEVDDSTQAKSAIRNNGEIKVSFFNERPPISPVSSWTSDYVYHPPFSPIGGSTQPSPTIWQTNNTLGFCSFSNPTVTTKAAQYSTNTMSTGGTTINTVSQPVAGSIETGRVEKGGASDQSFTTYSGSFNWFADENLTILIKPISGKPVEAGEIRNYCTNCSTRIKKSTWKFCPTCGTNIDS